MNGSLNALRKNLVRLLGLAVIGASMSAHAVIGALDNVPAATLLLPYFEVSLDDPNGVQTRFTVNNAAKVPTLAHVTLWTDLGVATYNFDLYLGGYDVVEVDLRLLFQGIIPQTGPGFGAPGPFSDPHTAFPGCLAGTFDLIPNAGLPAPDRLPDLHIAHLRAAHSGQGSPLYGGLCGGVDYGDQIARGYITIDTVGQCNSLFPSNPGYFANGGTGVALNDNVLFGHYTTLDRVNRFSAASPLVAIEADGADPLTITGGNHTFYGGYVGATAVDNREPLGTVWQARTLGAGIFQGGSELIVWLEPGGDIGPFACGGLPFNGSFPRAQTNLAAFDEQETGFVFPGGTVPLPWITQRVAADEFSPFTGGFVHLNLSTLLSAPPPYTVNDVLQSFVAVRHLVNGIYSVALPATRLFGPQHQQNGASSCTPDPPGCLLLSPLVQ